MITRFEIENFGCIKQVDFALTPLHAFIGPNDSGKSTILRAMHQLVNIAAGGEFSSGKLAATTPTGTYTVKPTDEASWAEILTVSGDVPFAMEIQPRSERSRLRRRHREHFASLQKASIVRFDPDAMRSPSPLMTESRVGEFLDGRGACLAGVVMAILQRGNSDFVAFSDAVRDLFPFVKKVAVPTVSPSMVALEVELLDGSKTRADQMSEGMLYYIAYEALRHFAPVSLLLVEEPENGLHPSRVADVMKVLRSISEGGTQVVLATHSPLVVNELKPEEVSLVTRRSLSEGTRVTPIRDTPNFEKRASVYSLGELWLSYANGVDEAPLLAPADVSKAAG